LAKSDEHFEPEWIWVEIQKTFWKQTLKIFVTLGLTILKFVKLNVDFDITNVDVNLYKKCPIFYEKLLLIASKSYKNLTKFSFTKFCEFRPRGFISWHGNSHIWNLTI